MKFLRKLILLMITIASLAACRKDNYKLYNGKARIQFGPQGGISYLPSYEMDDTLKAYTFFYQPANVMQDTVFFDVLAIGGPRNEDRSFVIEQVLVERTSNARPNVHYKAFSDPSLTGRYVIKAGQVQARIPIVLLRDPSLRTEVVTLKLQVKANDQFQLGEERLLWRKVMISDMVSRPSRWDAFGERYLWGKYSNVKHQFMITQTNEKWDNDFLIEITADAGIQNFWMQKLRTLLADYNRNHGEPLKDEDKVEVKFP